MTRARKAAMPDDRERRSVLAMLDHCFSPECPLIVSPAVYAAAMEDPDLRLRASRMRVNLPLPMGSAE